VVLGALVVAMVVVCGKKVGGSAIWKSWCRAEQQGEGDVCVRMEGENK